MKQEDFGGGGITVEFYDWILKNIKFGSTILELGSGDASTKYLGEKYIMYSIEDDKEFVGKYNSHYIYAPLKNGWYDAEIVKKGLPSKYDLILVDGPIGAPARVGFYKNLSLFNVSVPIILDDMVYWSDVLVRALEAKCGKKIVRFSSKAKGRNTFGVL